MLKKSLWKSVTFAAYKFTDFCQTPARTPPLAHMFTFLYLSCFHYLLTVHNLPDPFILASGSLLQQSHLSCFSLHPFYQRVFNYLYSLSFFPLSNIYICHISTVNSDTSLRSHWRTPICQYSLACARPVWCAGGMPFCHVRHFRAPCFLVALQHCPLGSILGSCLVYFADIFTSLNTKCRCP